MTFRVSHATWLATETERVKGLILTPRLWQRRWTDVRLRRELADIGLDYTLEEVQEINDALHTQGVVEDIPDE